MNPPNSTRWSSRGGIATVVLAYAALSALWILASDRALEWMIADPAQLVLAATLKGWLFIAITSLLLYLLLRGHEDVESTPAVSYPVGRSMFWPLALIGMAVTVMTIVAIDAEFRRQRDVEAARMQSIAEVKSRQIEDWLRERQGDAAFIGADPRLTAGYQRWSRLGNASSRAELLDLLQQYRSAKDYTEVVLLDPAGKTIWHSEGEQFQADARLIAAVKEATDRGDISPPSLRRDAAGRLSLDLVAPLFLRDGSPPPAVVLRTDPSAYLYPLLQSWPVPSASAETLLFRRDGGQVAYINDLRHMRDAAARIQAPIATQKLLAAQVLRGEIQPGRLFGGEDYRGLPVLGVARAVLGTDWFLIAKVDRSELYAGAWRNALWLTLAGLLILFMLVAAGLVWRQRQALHESLRQREGQAEKLRALELLQNLMRSSDDAITVKDEQGRYLLFNSGACRIFGRREDEVLGRDATAILPAAQAAQVIALDRELRETNCTRTVEENFEMESGPRYLLSTKGPLHDADGKVVGSFAIARDITERKQMELSLAAKTDSLRQSLSRTQLLVESALDAVISMDQEGRVTTWNSR